jgi:uncharacterized protein
MVLGRDKEKGILDEILQSPKAEFIAVYGRRRVGKTYLIRQYLKPHLVFDFTGSNQESNTVQLANFFREFKKQCIEKEDKPQNWSEAFALLSDYLHSLDKTKKVVVFFDEMPWLDKQKSGFLGALQYFWNQHGAQMPHLVLITCGSAASWMIKNITESTGGLYNRVTCRIELKPFNLKEVEAFLAYKNIPFTRYQILQLYMVLGGVPFYLDLIKPSKSVNQVIEELCFSENSMLRTEFKLLYHSLFKEAESHIKIIETLSAHTYGLTRQQLIEKTKIPQGGSFQRAIENLIDCGFIHQSYAFGKQNKETIFRVIDFYSIFYLRFIKENLGSQKNTWQSISEGASYQTWCGYAFENICMIHTNQIHKALGISGVHTQTCSWRFSGNDEMSGAQVDLLIDRKDGVIHLFEAKFTNKDFILTKDYNAKLRQKRAAFQYATKTKKMVVTSLLTTYPAVKNAYYLEEIFSEVDMDSLFGD